jgi:hypothetical protein
VNQDDDLMDKAKMHSQLNYLDKEIQHLVKNMSLFEMLEMENGGKSKNEDSFAAAAQPPKKDPLFSSNKRREERSEKKEEAKPSFAKEEPTVTEKPVPQGDDEEAVTDDRLLDDLSNLNIPEENEFADEYENEPAHLKPVEAVETTYNVSNNNANSSVSNEEDEDEIDLS